MAHDSARGSEIVEDGSALVARLHARIAIDRKRGRAPAPRAA
jgi:hypothetical protein